MVPLAGLGRRLPAPSWPRELGVGLPPRSLVIHSLGLPSVECAAAVHRHECPRRGLFPLPKFLPAGPARSLPVIELVVGFAKDVCESLARRFNRVNGFLDRVELWVSAEWGRVEAEESVGFAGSVPAYRGSPREGHAARVSSGTSPTPA